MLDDPPSDDPPSDEPTSDDSTSDEPGTGGPAGSGVLEVADITIRPGDEEAFLAAFRGARHVLASTPGCRNIRMTRGIESPARFVLLVEWDSVEAHEQNFRGSDRFATWREAIGPYFADPPYVEHFADTEQREQA